MAPSSIDSPGSIEIPFAPKLESMQPGPTKHLVSTGGGVGVGVGLGFPLPFCAEPATDMKQTAARISLGETFNMGELLAKI
jgi:hypothetical protein